MKKIILSALSIIALGSIVFISCAKKTDDNAITPKYAVDGAGTGGNPNTTNVTTTGTVATTSAANQNSSMSVGGGLWTSAGCSGQLCLTSTNSSSGASISICFSAVPVAGTYQLVSTAAANGAGKAFMTVSNPTGQPTGTTWYSSGGTVTVVVSGPSITASFNNITCFQAGSIFPSVAVSGQVGCI